MKPGMEVINVEPTSILAGSDPEMSGARSRDWTNGGTEDIGWDSEY